MIMRGVWQGNRARRPRLRQTLRPVRRAALALMLGAGGVGAAPLAAAPNVRAEFTDPTERYPHGVLGDTLEYGGLRIHGGCGTEAVPAPTMVTLPENRVFEDLAPRLADLDGDSCPEIIVVESEVASGAQLAVYDTYGNKIAATPHIGTRFRWLAPIGVADLDGDGHQELAYIDRPHLARILRIWRFRDGRLQEVAARRGLTNHRIGEGFITSGVRDCGEGPELVTASADWSRIIASRLRGGRIESRDIGAFVAGRGMGAALACKL